MDKIFTALIERLNAKGMDTKIIPTYIRNLAHFLVEDPSANLEEMEARMRSLGWSDFGLDGVTFYLISAVVSDESRSSTAKHAPVVIRRASATSESPPKQGRPG